MISLGYHLNILSYFMYFDSALLKLKMTSIENPFFDYCLSTNLGKNELPYGQGHTGDSSHWCGSRSLSDTF